MALRARTHIARRLRRDSTEVEKILWRGLRERIPGAKFRRQHPIGRFIADFACPGAKLVIEIDGGQHAERQEGDERRTAELARHGYRVIQFWNNDVLDNLEGVLEAIRLALASPPTSPGLSAPEGGEGKMSDQAPFCPSPPRGAERSGEVGLRATAVESPGRWPQHQARGTVTLAYDDRHRRRIELETDAGEPFLVDLPRATLLGDGDGLALSDGTWLAVKAAPEALLEITAAAPELLARLAWHIGNRHVPAQIEAQRLLIRDDHVIAAMLEGLGARVRHLTAPFTPERGAYASPPHAHAHAHGHDH